MVIGQLCAETRSRPVEIERAVESAALAEAFVAGVLRVFAGEGDQAAMRRMLEDRWFVWRLAGIRTIEHWSRYGGPLDAETIGALERLAEGDPREEVSLRAKEVLEESETRAQRRGAEQGDGDSGGSGTGGRE